MPKAMPLRHRCCVNTDCETSAATAQRLTRVKTIGTRGQMTIAKSQRRYLLAGRHLLLAALVLAASGCVLPATGRDGSRHYIVVGAGIVSVPGPDADGPVTAVKLQAVGLVAGLLPTARVVLGYVNTHQVEVAANADSTMVELSDAIGGPVTISVSTADLQEIKP